MVPATTAMARSFTTVTLTWFRGPFKGNLNSYSLGFRVLSHYNIMENQIEKNMEHEMETGGI